MALVYKCASGLGGFAIWKSLLVKIDCQRWTIHNVMFLALNYFEGFPVGGVSTVE